MKLLLCILLLSEIFCPFETWAEAAELPPRFCSKKLQTTSQNSSTHTEEFKTFLSFLLEKRVLSIQDLKPFLTELGRGNLVNPVPHQNSVKFSVHYLEFESLLNESQLDVTEIKAWVDQNLNSVQLDEQKKEITKTLTQELPVYVAPNGAMFYKINHSKLGEAIRILKPNGKYYNSEDWESIIWAVHPIRDQNAKVVLFKNTSTFFSKHHDPKSKVLVSLTSPARKACLDLGPNIDLPTNDEYTYLLNFFDHGIERHLQEYSGKIESLALTPNGVTELEKIFKNTQDWGAWTSSTYKKEYASFYMGRRVYSDWYGLRSEPRPSRCIERTR